MAARVRAALLGVGLVLTLATCRDGMEPQVQLAPIAVAPVLPSNAALASFGLAIDRVRFIVVRPTAAPDTLADTTVALLPDSASLEIDIRVPLIAAAEVLEVSIVVLSGTIPLFQGTAPVEVRSGAPPATPTEIPVLTYVGPGAGVDRIAITPAAPFLFFNDSLQFQVEAFQGGVPVTQFYVSWSTSDTNVARVNGVGLLRAPAVRNSVRVVARTPGGQAVDSTTATFQPVANQLIPIAGNGQAAVFGTLLTVPLEVEARAADGLGVGGVAVRFRAQAGGGSVADTVVITDNAGRARTFATLGPVVGGQAFEASATGLGGSPLAFNATALAGPPAEVLAAAGDAQLAVVNSTVGVAPSVVIRDGSGNPVAGVPVTFSVTAGGGMVTGGSQTTGSNGVAAVSAWQLGTIAGINRLQASAAGLSRTFTATAIAGTATALAVVAGDLQSVTVGTPLPIKPAVRVQDQYGNPVAGTSVTFALAGPGSITGATQLTNAAGVATVGSWTLDTLAGPNVLNATAGPLSATFTATGLAGAPALLVKTLGDGQSGVVNTALSVAPTVQLADRYGNPVAGETINFSVLDGGSIAAPAPVSDASGAASGGTWTLATLAGQNRLRADVPGHPTVAAVEFGATGTRDVAAQLVRASIDTQTALAGNPVDVPPEVQVVDQYLNPVPGVTVTFSLTGIPGGTVVPSSEVTDGFGIARVGTWTLATTPGLNTLQADALSLAPVSFSANGITTTATDIALDGGDGQTGTVGQPLTIGYSVSVKDAAGLPVSGVQVRWAVGSGGGSISPATSNSDGAGIATAFRTLGPTAGTQTATASVTGLAGSPITFSATALADAPAQLLPISTNPQSAIVGTAVASPPKVKVADQFNNPLPGVGVIFAVALGGGSVTGPTQTTDAAGTATVGSWTLGIVAGFNNNQLTATVSGLSAITFTASALAGPPAALAFLDEPTRAVAGDTIAPPVRLAFTDQFGNTTLTNDFVSLQLGNAPTPGAKLLGTTDIAAANGIAVFPDLAVDSAGSGFTVIATSPKVLGSQPSQAFDIGGVIDAVTGDRLDPVDATFDRATGLVFVPGQTNTLGVFDPGKRELLQFPILQSPPFGVAVNSQTSRVYVTTQAGFVMIVDSRDPSTLLQVIDVGGAAKGIAIDEGTDRVFVAVDGDPGKGIPPTLVIISGTEILGPIFFDEGAQSGLGVAFNPLDQLVYVAIPNLGVGVFDPAKLEHVTTIPIFSERGAAGTYDVEFDIRTRLVYATNRDDGSVSVVDPVSFKEIDGGRVRVGLLPEGIGLDADRGLIFVANSGENTVSFLANDPKSGQFTVFATLVVGPAPKAAAVDPGSGRVYMPTFTDSRVRVVQP